ncbi:E3 SUMO-protein ligase pli1 [Coemansia sp. RSA 2618]|nr:E3 SUMO-protein ligase pli1 [Coemansia sp. RSA 2618]
MSKVDLEKITFGEFGLLFPKMNIVAPFVCAASHSRLHSKAITTKLTEDQLDLLQSNPGDPEGEKYGVCMYIANYATLCTERRLNHGARARVFMPQRLHVKVNGAYEPTLLQLPNTQARPIDLTQMLQKTTEVANRVDINYMSHGPLVVAISLTVQHTPQSMARHIRETNMAAADDVRSQFFGKQSDSDDDDDVIAEGALVNLKCPLGLCRIKVPCRARQCQHAQCFDCATFLQFYSNAAQWKCPVCSVHIKSWGELIIDGYFEDILLKTSESDEQVFVEPNGDWKPKGDVAGLAGSGGKAHGRPLDVETDDGAIDLSDLSDVGNNNDAARSKRRRTDFVDLTLDSDDDGVNGDDNGEDDLPLMTQEEIDMISTLEADANTSSGTISTNGATTVEHADARHIAGIITSSECCHAAHEPKSSAIGGTACDIRRDIFAGISYGGGVVVAFADAGIPFQQHRSNNHADPQVVKQHTSAAGNAASTGWRSAGARPRAPTTTVNTTVEGNEITGSGARAAQKRLRAAASVASAALQSHFTTRTRAALPAQPAHTTGVASTAVASSLPATPVRPSMNGRHSSSAIATASPLQSPGSGPPLASPLRSPRSPMVGVSSTYLTLFQGQQANNTSAGGPTSPRTLRPTE